jgi:hypothetical protein
MFVIYMIWALWFINLLVNMIILLNFLIAIVSQSYDRVLSNSLNYEYEHKSELNNEVMRVRLGFSPLPCFDTMCIVSNQN